MVEQLGNGWVGHSVTRVKCNEMRSLELFNAGGTADNISLFAPGCILHPGAFLCEKALQDVRYYYFI